MHDSTCASTSSCGSKCDAHLSTRRTSAVGKKVHNLPDTKFADDGNFLGNGILNKGVVERLATHVVNAIPATLTVWERCLGFLTHGPVTARLVHTCTVAVHAPARGANQFRRQGRLLCATILQENRKWGRFLALRF